MRCHDPKRQPQICGLCAKGDHSNHSNAGYCGSYIEGNPTSGFAGYGCSCGCLGCSGDRSFAYALWALKSGWSVTRALWKFDKKYKPSCWLVLHHPDEHNKLTEPYLYYETHTGVRAPYTVTSKDLLADDWEIKE